MENNIFKKIKKSISATILCLRFPFLYPRNRFTDKHYNNWWIQNQIKRCHDQYMQVMSVNICTQAYIDHIKENKSEPDTNTYGTGFSKTRKQSISRIFNINNTEVRVSKDGKNIKFHIYGNTPNSIQSIPLEKYLHSDTFDKSELYTGNITDVYFMQTTTITNTFVGTNTSQGYSVLLVSDKSNEVDTQYKGFVEVIMDPLQKYIISMYNFIENVLGVFHCIPTYTELGAMPVGWRKAFGMQICKDIRHALIYTVIDKENITWKTPGKRIKAYITGFKYLFNYRITQIKEKFGGLRWYDERSTEAVHNIIDKYESISYNTCIHCGKPAEYMTTGWISPYCADCLSEDEKQTAKKLNKQNGTEKLDNLVSE